MVLKVFLKLFVWALASGSGLECFLFFHLVLLHICILHCYWPRLVLFCVGGVKGKKKEETLLCWFNVASSFLFSLHFPQQPHSFHNFPTHSISFFLRLPIYCVTLPLFNLFFLLL